MTIRTMRRAAIPGALAMTALVRARSMPERSTAAPCLSRGREGRACCGRQPASPRATLLDRHPRDVLCARIHTPQPDAAPLAAGRAALSI